VARSPRKPSSPRVRAAERRKAAPAAPSKAPVAAAERPAPQSGTAEPQASLTASPPERSTSPTILVVEDESDLRVLAESIIADFGYRTLSAGNSREALVLLEEHDDVTVLFTDINLPDAAV
jgi:PleD family two-component response regulator